MFICMVGLPGSGKSTFAKKYKERYDAEIVSTDSIREELYGGEAVQGDGKEVFVLAFQRVNQLLHTGKSVIFDATSISAKARRRVLGEVNWYKGSKVCVLVATPVEWVLKQNASRDRIVPEEVIYRMLKNFNTPMEEEGWDSIVVVNSKIFDVEKYFYLVVKDVAHDNPHHQRDIWEHSYCMAAAYIENGGRDRDLYTAIRYHDIGKPLTKFFGEDGVAHYYSHGNVGAYLFLSGVDTGEWELKSEREIAWLIENHMVPFQQISEKFRRKWGEERCRKLRVINWLDQEWA